MGRLLDRARSRRSPGDARVACRLRRALTPARGRVLARRHHRGTPRRRSARPAAGVRGRLLRRLPARPRRQQRRAVHHDTLRSGGNVDHLWIRVADVAASKRFYETIAPHAGLRLGTDTPERAQFCGASGSFSVLAGTPTEHLHMAFGASADATVDAFHGAATGAGYRDNGAPGERPDYHAGY
jgi:hypothetical protein